MDPYDINGKTRIIENLANLSIKASSIMSNLPPKNPVREEFSGLMHDIRYHIELVNIFHPLDDSIKKFTKSSDMKGDAIVTFVTRVDRNIRKSFVTMTLFSLETILKIIAKHHGIKIPKNKVIDKYKKTMRYFKIYSEEKENLIKILHYTRNTLHNGDRVDQESHLQYKGKSFNFIPKQKQKEEEKLESTDWFNLIFFLQDLFDIFIEIVKSKKYSLT